MSMTHVVRFGAGKARRYLAQATTAGNHEQGWRPFVWTKDLARAEKFSSAEAARIFALGALGHAQWEIGIAPPSGRPNNNLGGSPVAIRVAA